MPARIEIADGPGAYAKVRGGTVNVEQTWCHRARCGHSRQRNPCRYAASRESLGLGSRRALVVAGLSRAA